MGFCSLVIEARYLVTETLTMAKPSHKIAEMAILPACTVVINKMLALQAGKAISKA